MYEEELCEAQRHFCRWEQGEYLLDMSQVVRKRRGEDNDFIEVDERVFSSYGRQDYVNIPLKVPCRVLKAELYTS